jgi:hypothetical protein
MRARVLAGTVLTSVVFASAVLVSSVGTASAATTIDLIAGKTVDVGDVTISNDSANIFVKIVPTGGACITQSHLAAAIAPGALPQTRTGNAIPGKFPYAHTYRSSCPTADQYTVPLSAIAGYVPGAAVYLAVHAEVTQAGSTDRDTAWASGVGFPGANWSTYASVKLTPEVLTFDEFTLSPGGEQPIPSGYGGFAWNQAGVFQPSGTQYGGYATKSAPNLGFIAEAGSFEVAGYPSPGGTPATATASDFTFIGAWFSAVYRDGLLLTVDAYDDGVLVGHKTVTVNRFGPTWFAFDDATDAERFESIDRIAMVADDNDVTTWDYFGFDDFTYFPSVA